LSFVLRVFVRLRRTNTRKTNSTYLARTPLNQDQGFYESKKPLGNDLTESPTTS
jgi:hypothetical protein